MRFYKNISVREICGQIEMCGSILHDREVLIMQNSEFYIDHDGIALHAKLDVPATESKIVPLVIIQHGYTGHMEEPHITAIAKAMNDIGFAALRIELYGHGKSGGTFREHTVAKWVSELLTVIDYAAGLDFAGDLYLIGHSQGGLAVMLAAAMKRDVIKALIPLAPAIMIRDDARKGCSFDIHFDPEHIPQELVMNEERTLSGNYFRTAQFLPVEEAIQAYTGPVLIVHADTDETVPVHYAESAAHSYANAKLHIVAGDDHCFDRKIGEVTEVMTRFLLEVQAG